MKQKIDGAEVGRVRELVRARLAEHEDRDGGIFVQAAAVIDLLLAVARVGGCGTEKKIELLFLSMWSASGYGPILFAGEIDDPPFELRELARDSVARAVRDAKASSNVLVPVLVEWLVRAAGANGPAHAPGLAQWMLAKLKSQIALLDRDAEMEQLVQLH